MGATVGTQAATLMELQVQSQQLKVQTQELDRVATESAVLMEALGAASTRESKPAVAPSEPKVQFASPVRHVLFSK